MLLFKRKIRSKTAPVNITSTEVYNKWQTVKQNFAGYLQRKSGFLSMPAKKYALIFFCFLFGGSSIIIIIHAVQTKGKALQVTKLSKPAHLNDSNEMILAGDSIIRKEEYERVIHFKNSMLQLKDDSTGRKKFDSIIQLRPQLMDSIALFEKLYLSQK